MLVTSTAISLCIGAIFAYTLYPKACLILKYMKLRFS